MKGIATPASWFSHFWGAVGKPSQAAYPHPRSEVRPFNAGRADHAGIGITLYDHFGNADDIASAVAAVWRRVVVVQLCQHRVVQIRSKRTLYGLYRSLMTVGGELDRGCDPGRRGFAFPCACPVAFSTIEFAGGLMPIRLLFPLSFMGERVAVQGEALPLGSSGPKHADAERPEHRFMILTGFESP